MNEYAQFIVQVVVLACAIRVLLEVLGAGMWHEIVKFVKRLFRGSSRRDS